MIKYQAERRHFYVAITIFIALLSTMPTRSVTAAINQSFTYQGKIVNTDGTNVTSTEASCISTGGADTCDFRVSLYDASAGGTLVWQETKSDVELYDNDGIFNLFLDCSGTFSSCNQNGGPDFTSGELFVEVEFDPSGNGDFAEGETFNPRRELSAVPYAFNALTADSATDSNTLDSLDSTDFLRSNSADTFEAGAILTIDGTLDTNADISFADTAIIFDGANTEFTFTGNLTINTDDLAIDKGTGNASFAHSVDISGDTFIGGSTAGTADIFLGSSGAVVINEQGLDSDFRIDGSGVSLESLFFADASTGRTGVGTSSPTAYLDLPSSVTAAATMRIRGGTAPTAPNEGDIYADGTDIFYRTGAGAWVDLTAGAGATTLQNAYDAGNTITTSNPSGALTFDAAAANIEFLVGQGGDTGDLRIYDGTNNWFFIDESTSAITLGNNQAATGLSLTSGTTWSLSSAGALSGISTLSSSGDWTWTAATPTITVNSTETVTISDGTDTYTINTSASSFGMSDGSNSVTFDLDTGPAFAGTARPTRSIILTPEYSGAVLSAYYGAGTDTNTTGTMTSDTDTSPASSIRNYYNWIRGAATQHFYTVAVRVTLPPDFSAWQTSNAMVIEYQTQSATSTDSSVDARVYHEGTNPVQASSTGNASTSWATISFTGANLGNFTGAGETGVIYLRLGSQSGNYARIGDITLNYLASY